MKRVLFDIGLFVSLFIFPWWIGVLMFFVGIFLFKNFYEFIAAGCIVYSLYVPENGRIFSSPIFFSLITVAMYFIIQYLRTNIILYKK